MTSPPLAQLAGIFPVFQTPYHENESIDFETLAGEIDWLFDCGVDGVGLAMVSEVLRLSHEERRQLAERVVAQARGRGGVIVSVGAESTRMSQELARHAESIGAAAIMSIPPVAVAVADAELSQYYQRLIRTVAVPVIVQDAAGYVGRPMSIELQAQLLEQFGPDRVLFKPEAPPIGPHLSALRDRTGGKARIFEGTGGIALVDSYRRGIVGTMPGADLIKGIVALWRALKAGDERRIYSLSLPICSLIAVQNSLDAFLAIEKYLLVKQGVFINTIVRGPVGYVLDEDTRCEIDRLFNRVMQAVEGK